MKEHALKNAREATNRWRELTEALEHAKHERDQAIRAAAESGCAQVELIKETELTRETLRRILNPEAAAAVKKSAAQRRAAKKKEEAGDG